MTDVLIYCRELADLITKEPCVIIDTAEPMPMARATSECGECARDLHYLATSTAEHERIEDQVRRCVRRRRLSGKKPPSSTSNR